MRSRAVARSAGERRLDPRAVVSGESEQAGDDLLDVVEDLGEPLSGALLFLGHPRGREDRLLLRGALRKIDQSVVAWVAGAAPGDRKRRDGVVEVLVRAAADEFADEAEAVRQRPRVEDGGQVSQVLGLVLFIQDGGVGEAEVLRRRVDGEPVVARAVRRDDARRRDELLVQRPGEPPPVAVAPLKCRASPEGGLVAGEMRLDLGGRLANDAARWRYKRSGPASAM